MPMRRAVVFTALAVLAASPVRAGPPAETPRLREIKHAATGFAVALPVPLVTTGVPVAGPETVRFRLFSETGAPPQVAAAEELCSIAFTLADPSGAIAHLSQEQLNADEIVDAASKRLTDRITATGHEVENAMPILFDDGGVRGIEILFAPAAVAERAAVRSYMAVAYTPKGVITLRCATSPDAMEQARILFRTVAWGARVSP